jgi:hypothetical protein
MATTSNTYTGNGSNKLFSITFPYLETTDVDVYLNGTLQTITTQYTFANATTIEFVAAPANGAVVLLDRSTDDATLQATFFPGSSIKAADLNLDFDQVLYIAQETSNEATTATSTAASATTTANTALSQSAAAVSTANTASSNASAAVSTANTASTNASNAVTTANTASSNATTAVNTANAATSTANSAASDASTALSTANTALTNANSAVTTANTASSNATAAVSTANTASTNASNAVTTANSAVTTANGAVTTANTADTNSNTAITTANAAAAAVANAVLYTTVANVAAIPGSPANNAAVEVTNSTGIESFTPLSGLPAGFIGSSGLSVRIIYQTSGATWTWIQYFPNDPETRYLKLAGGTLTGALGVTAGTAAAPSLFISGSTNTGLYSPGADQVAISTGGSGRLFVDASGRVGVGASDPKGTLHVAGTTGITQALSAGEDALKGLVNIGTVGTSGGSLVVRTAGVNANESSGLGIDGTYSHPVSTINIKAFSAASAAYSSQITFQTQSGSASPATRMMIDSSGRVGIGTSSPTNTLHVVGSGDTVARISATSDTNLTFSETTANKHWNLKPSAGDFYFQYSGTAYNSGYSNLLTIKSTGNVGIGTTSPGMKLTINDTTTAQIQLGYNDSIYGRIGRNSSGNYEFSSYENGGNLLFGTTGTTGSTTERARIDSSGRLGIGTTGPAAALHVVAGGTAAYFISNASSAGVSIGSDTNLGKIGTNGSTCNLAFNIDGAEKARIDTSGRFLVGTSSTLGSGVPSYSKFQLIGNTQFSNSYGGLTLGRAAAANSITSGQSIGYIGFSDNAGAEFAAIACDADANAGTNDYPGRLTFSTTADGASSPTERFRISSTGAQSSVIPGGSTLYPSFGCRAWVNFNGTGTLSIRASGNISSVTDNGTGDFSPNLSNSMPDANYAVTSFFGTDSGSTGNGLFASKLVSMASFSFRIRTGRPDNGVLSDPDYAMLAIFR